MSSQLEHSCERPAPKFKHDIQTVALETGLSKEVIRKWESRYGYPRPERDANSERLYSTDQVRGLREIYRLTHAGIRPGAAIRLFLSDEAWVSPLVTEELSTFSQSLIEALAENDKDKVYFLLQRQLLSDGVIPFLEETITEANRVVGLAWAHGLIRIYQEHLYSDVVQGILNKEILDLPSLGDSPIQVLLATPPNEIHTIGLHMVELWLKFHGIRSISLGAQVPLAELLDATRDISPSVVGVSLSSAYPNRHASNYIHDLACAVPDGVELWLGGMGSPRNLSLPDHVRHFDSLVLIRDRLSLFS